MGLHQTLSDVINDMTEVFSFWKNWLAVQHVFSVSVVWILSCTGGTRVCR